MHEHTDIVFAAKKDVKFECGHAAILPIGLWSMNGREKESSCRNPQVQ
jgi:hypothetical protein